jgi:hypothetical protein
MKRWQVLLTALVLVSFGLAGYSVGASRQASDIAVAVKSQLTTGSLAVRRIVEAETYGPSGAPNYVPAAPKEVFHHSGYNPLEAKYDPWIYNFQFVEDMEKEFVREVRAEEQTSVAGWVESDCPDGWEPENNFYQPIKVHIDWDLGDPDPWD